MHSSLTLSVLNKKITNILNDNIVLFNGLTISDVSIKEKLGSNKHGYYNGSDGNTKTKTSLLIKSDVIKDFSLTNPSPSENCKFDITIESVYISNYGTVVIVASKIKETGISHSMLLYRKLKKYAKDKNYIPHIKKHYRGL